MKTLFDWAVGPFQITGSFRWFGGVAILGLEWGKTWVTFQVFAFNLNLSMPVRG